MPRRRRRKQTKQQLETSAANLVYKSSHEIQKDLRGVLGVLLIAILLLIAFYWVDAQTTYIDQLSKTLYNFLNL